MHTVSWHLYFFKIYLIFIMGREHRYVHVNASVPASLRSLILKLSHPAWAPGTERGSSEGLVPGHNH